MFRFRLCWMCWYHKNLSLTTCSSGGAISWKSAKQSVIFASNMEARFSGMLWDPYSWLMAAELYFRTWNCWRNCQAADILDDSMIVFFSKNDKYYNSSRHIEIKYSTAKEEVHKQRVSIKHSSTSLMIVDPSMIGLSLKTFNKCVERMGIIGHYYWYCIMILLSLFNWHSKLIYIFLIFSLFYLVYIIILQ